MKSSTILLGSALALALVSANAAQATTLNFDLLPSGAVASNTYAGQGVTINAAVGVDAQANIAIVTGVNNSTYGNGGDPTRGNYPYYPTHETTTFDFSTGVSGLSFFFNNYGTNNRSTFSAYGTSGLISSGNIGADNGVMEFVAGSGITQLVVTNAGDDWIYGIDSLTFTPGGVPEPGMWALMLVGFGGLGVALRGQRRKPVAA
jgi:hypothetical protein